MWGGGGKGERQSRRKMAEILNMATHSRILAWRIPVDREEPEGLQSVGSQRVGHD